MLLNIEWFFYNLHLIREIIVRLSFSLFLFDKRTNCQIEYDEQEPFNGDSSALAVDEAFFSTEQVGPACCCGNHQNQLHQPHHHYLSSQLQPGRNYSVAVRSVSNGMESLARRVFVATSEK